MPARLLLTAFTIALVAPLIVLAQEDPCSLVGYTPGLRQERTAKILDRSSRWAFPGSFIVVVLTTLVLG